VDAVSPRGATTASVMGGSARPGVPARAPSRRRTHPRAALLHGGQHSQGAGRAGAEVEEVQRRARRLLQDPAWEPRVLRPPRPFRARRRHGQQQQQREQRGAGPGRGRRLPAGLHGRGRLAGRSTEPGSVPAHAEIRPRRPHPPPPGGRRSEPGSPLGRALPAAPPRCPRSVPGRRGACVSAGAGTGSRGQWASPSSLSPRRPEPPRAARGLGISSPVPQPCCDFATLGLQREATLLAKDSQQVNEGTGGERGGRSGLSWGSLILEVEEVARSPRWQRLQVDIGRESGTRGRVAAEVGMSTRGPATSGMEDGHWTAGQLKLRPLEIRRSYLSVVRGRVRSRIPAG
jgi:hypothetical protein